MDTQTHLFTSKLRCYNQISLELGLQLTQLRGILVCILTPNSLHNGYTAPDMFDTQEIWDILDINYYFLYFWLAKY